VEAPTAVANDPNALLLLPSPVAFALALLFGPIAVAFESAALLLIPTAVALNALALLSAPSAVALESLALLEAP